MQNGNLIENAVAAVRTYQSCQQDREFGYDCNSNPEGVSDADLYRSVRIAEDEMYRALAALDDKNIEIVLQQTKDRDHDGSYFMSTSLEEVRRRQSENADVVKAIENLSLEAAVDLLRKASLSPINAIDYVEGHREQLLNEYLAGGFRWTFVQSEIMAINAEQNPEATASAGVQTQELVKTDRMSVMSKVLASLAGAGDIFSDAPEVAGAVAATQNLAVLARYLAADTEVLCSGDLLVPEGGIVVDVDCRVDGSLIVDLPDGIDATEHSWAFRPRGSDHTFRVKLFCGEFGDDETWVVDEPDRFYEAVVMRGLRKELSQEASVSPSP